MRLILISLLYLLIVGCLGKESEKKEKVYTKAFIQDIESNEETIKVFLVNKDDIDYFEHYIGNSKKPENTKYPYSIVIDIYIKHKNYCVILKGAGQKKINFKRVDFE